MESRLLKYINLFQIKSERREIDFKEFKRYIMFYLDENIMIKEIPKDKIEVIYDSYKVKESINSLIICSDKKEIVISSDIVAACISEYKQNNKTIRFIITLTYKNNFHISLEVNKIKSTSLNGTGIPKTCFIKQP